MLPSAEVLLEFSKESARNARTLADDAHVLAEHERWARATALMILAREELGKALYAWMLGLGCAPEKDNSMSVLSGRHREKQVMVEVLDAPVVSDVVSQVFAGIAIPDIADPCSPESKLAFDALAADLRARVDSLDTDPVQWRRFAEEGGRSWVRIVVEGELERLKQRALYVDLPEVGSKVRTPAEVTRSDFERVSQDFDRGWRVYGEVLLQGFTRQGIEWFQSWMRGAR